MHPPLGTLFLRTNDMSILKELEFFLMSMLELTIVRMFGLIVFVKAVSC
jgi:hypothetical protein